MNFYNGCIFILHISPLQLPPVEVPVTWSVHGVDTCCVHYFLEHDHFFIDRDSGNITSYLEVDFEDNEYENNRIHLGNLMTRIEYI